MNQIGSVSFLVRLRLVPTSAGGRQSTLPTEYRTIFQLGNVWEGQPTSDSGRLLMEPGQEIAPGEEGPARLEPLVPEQWTAVAVGAVVPVHEGQRVVGHATVVAVVRPNGDIGALPAPKP